MWSLEDPRKVFGKNTENTKNDVQIAIWSLKVDNCFGGYVNNNFVLLINRPIGFKSLGPHDPWPEDWKWTLAPDQKNPLITSYEELIIRQLLCVRVNPDLAIFSQYKNVEESKKELLSYLGGNALKVAKAIIDMYMTTNDMDQLEKLVSKIEPHIKSKALELTRL
jgi:hypothetical protein